MAEHRLLAPLVLVARCLGAGKEHAVKRVLHGVSGSSLAPSGVFRSSSLHSDYRLPCAPPDGTARFEQMIAPDSTPTASAPDDVMHGVASQAWRASALHPFNGSVETMTISTSDERLKSRADKSVVYRRFSA